MKKRVFALLLAGMMIGCTTSGVYAEENDASQDEEITISLWKWIPVEGLQMDTVMEAWKKTIPIST